MIFTNLLWAQHEPFYTITRRRITLVIFIEASVPLSPMAHPCQLLFYLPDGLKTRSEEKSLAHNVWVELEVLLEIVLLIP